MLNTDRIKLMTRLGAYEERQGKEVLPVVTYFKNDYIIKNMIWTAITTTIAFLLVMVLWVVFRFEFYLEHLAQMNLILLALRVVIFYAAALILSEVAAYFVFDYKYRRARKLLKPYAKGLKELEELYKKEDKAKLGLTAATGGGKE